MSSTNKSDALADHERRIRELEAQFAYLKRGNARAESKAISDGKTKPHNLDENNVTILEAELKNLKLGKNLTDEEKSRIAYLEKRIPELKASGNMGGNPHHN